MEATQAKVVQFPQVVYHAIPGTQQQVLNAIVKHRSAVWQKMHGWKNACGIKTDIIMPEESHELHEKVSKSYCALVNELEKLPNGEKLMELFGEYVCDIDEYELYCSEVQYIKGIMDGAFSFRDIGEVILEESSK